MSLDIVIVGLSITSSWGNGHATTYRALVKALAERGHSVTFLKVKGHADRTKSHVSSEQERFNQLCDQLAVAAVPA